MKSQTTALWLCDIAPAAVISKDTKPRPVSFCYVIVPLLLAMTFIEFQVSIGSKIICYVSLAEKTVFIVMRAEYEI